MTAFGSAGGDERAPLWRDLVLAVLPVVAVSAIGSAVTVPQIAGWYAGLAKPSFNPPNWLFGPVWTALYALMALAVFRILRLPRAVAGRSAALFAYHLQLGLNLLWSCAFFGLRSPLAGLVVILPLLALILLTSLRFGRLDRFAGMLLWPYAAWVGFAALLNIAIWRLNG